MNLSLDDQQRLIVDSANEFLNAQCSLERVRGVLASPSGWDADLWQSITELGWCGVHVHEDQNGLGLGFVELCLLQEQLGQRLACVPFFDAVAMSASVLRALPAHPLATQALDKLITIGEPIACALHGPWSNPLQMSKAHTFHSSSGQWMMSGVWPQVGSASLARHLILEATDDTGESGIFLVPANSHGLSIHAQACMDGTRISASVHAHEVALSDSQCLAKGETLETLKARVICLAAIALAAEQVGVAQASLQLALAYTQERVQFDKPVASFQAVKHRCAEMLVALETARSAVYGAACLADTHTGQPTLLRAAAQARESATRAALYNSRECIQLHGGVGYTWEYHPHLFFRRAQACSQTMGPVSWWLEQVACQLLDPQEVNT